MENLQNKYFLILSEAKNQCLSIYITYSNKALLKDFYSCFFIYNIFIKFTSLNFHGSPNSNRSCSCKKSCIATKQIIPVNNKLLRRDIYFRGIHLKYNSDRNTLIYFNKQKFAV